MLPGAAALKDLTKQMLKVLTAIERGMSRAQYVEIDTIKHYSGLNMEKTEYWLSKAHKLDLIRRWTGHFVGYELTIHGYDALALNALYEKGEIHGFGMAKGTGKESIVFFVETSAGEERLAKLHRVGFTSFQHVRKKRRYTSNKHHISPLYSSRLSAESEFKWLKVAHDANLAVPQPFAQNRHVIIMEHIRGYDLNTVSKIEDVDFVIEQVMNFIKGAWNAGFIHGDLSEFNIIINEDSEITVIDFPQAEKITHENWEELLERDIKNVARFFRSKFGVKINLEEVKKEIMGETPNHSENEIKY